MLSVETTLDYAIFQNYGYMGLYGGLKASDIKERKGLKKSQDILDYMGYEELAANLFRATQTEAKLRRENIQGKQEANKTHFEVGKRCVTPLKILVAQCRKICLHRKKYSAIRERAKEKIEIKNQPSAPTPALITGQTDKSP